MSYARFEGQKCFELTPHILGDKWNCAVDNLLHAISTLPQYMLKIRMLPCLINASKVLRSTAQYFSKIPISPLLVVLGTPIHHCRQPVYLLPDLASGLETTTLHTCVNEFVFDRVPVSKLFVVIWLFWSLIKSRDYDYAHSIFENYSGTGNGNELLLCKTVFEDEAI